MIICVEMEINIYGRSAARVKNSHCPCKHITSHVGVHAYIVTQFVDSLHCKGEKRHDAKCVNIITGLFSIL